LKGWRKNNGFTLIEMTVSMVIFFLIITSTMSLYKYQAIFSSRIEQDSEMQDNLRMAIYWITKDLKETSEIVQLGDGSGNEGLGPGPGIDNAFQLIVDDDTISYFYRNDPITKNVFYRYKGGLAQPISNEYIFNGTNKGYIKGWEIRFYDDENNILTYDDPVDPTVIDAVRRVEVTLYGSYPDKNRPNQEIVIPMHTSVKMRVSPTP